MAMTIKQALTNARELSQVSDSWQLDAELLLAEALKSSREYLRTWPERELGDDNAEYYQQLLVRRGQGEPIAYILGRKAFWDFELRVNSNVLIPRPETELLVEQTLALTAGRATTALRLADLGTGSGAIGLALARELPASHVTAVDISPAALSLAQHNADSLGVSNIEFRQHAWCEKLEDDCYDVIVSNPPYVATDDAHLQQGDLRFEPIVALVAQNSGLSAIIEIIKESRRALKKDAWLLIEHGYQQGTAVKALFLAHGFDKVAGRQDIAGQDRITFGHWSGF